MVSCISRWNGLTAKALLSIDRWFDNQNQYIGFSLYVLNQHFLKLIEDPTIFSYLQRLLGYKDSRFHVRLYCVWERDSLKFTTFGLKDGEMVLKDKVNDRDSDDESDDEVDDMTSEEEVSEDENGDQSDMEES